MDPALIAIIVGALVPALVEIGKEIGIKSLLKPARELADEAVMARFDAEKLDTRIVDAMKKAAADVGLGPADGVWLGIAIDTLAAPGNEQLRQETVDIAVTMASPKAMPPELPDKLRVPRESKDRFAEFLYNFRRYLVANEEFERPINYEDHAALLHGQDALLHGQDELRQLIIGLAQRQEVLPSAQIPTEAPAASASAPEKALLTQVDEARNLRLDGKPTAARNILENLYQVLEGTDVSDKLRYHLETNLGACELDLGNAGEAARLFKHALQYFPESPKALANAALAEAIEGQYQSAADLAGKALASDTGNQQKSAAAIRVSALAHVRDFRDVEELYDATYRDNADYMRAMGSIFVRAGNLAKAAEMFRHAVELNGNDDTSLMSLSEIIFREQALKYRGQVFVTPVGRDAYIDGLFEAENLIDKAVSILERGDNRPRLFDALAARAGVRASRGKVDEASQDCERVLAQDPNHAMALYNRGLIARQKGEFETAARFLTRVREGVFQSVNGFLPLAEIYVNLNQPQQALDVLARMPKELAEQHYIEAFVVENQALIRKGDIEEAEKRKVAVIAAHPNHPVLLESCAFLESLKRRPDAELAYLLDAHRCAEKPDQDRIGLRIASRYSERGQFLEALPYLSQVENLTASDNPHALQYLNALYKTRDFGKAQEVAQRLRAIGSSHPLVLQVLAWIGEQAGDLAVAADYYAELARIEPGNPKHRVAQARVEFRRGRTEVARGLLLPLKQVKNADALDLMDVAQMLVFLGETDGVIQLAYRARRLGFDIPRLHLAYFQIFTNVSNSEPGRYDVEEVGGDTAVLVDNLHGEKRWLQILASHPADRARAEFALDDPTARLLVGHHQGDVVPIKRGPLEELTYRIEDIQSIYVRAFQEIPENFSTWFPEHGGIFQVRVEPEDPTRILTIVAGRSVQADELYSAYESGQCTFSQLAALAGTGEVDLWYSLAGSPKRRLIASLGTGFEQAVHRKRVKDAQKVTLDLTALLTLQYLNRFDALRQQFSHLYVSQASIDAINHSIWSLTMTGKPGFGSISYEDGKFAMHEFSVEEIEASIQRRKALLNLTLGACTVVPIAAESITLFQREPHGELWHQHSIETLLVARQTSSSLYADDLKLRSVVESQLGITGFWTQPLLEILREENHLTDEQYFDDTIRLIQAHYYYTSVEPALVMYVLEKNSLHMTPDVIDVLKTLEGPHTDQDDAVRIVADTLAAVWLARWLEEQRIMVLDQCLHVLTANRPHLIVLHKLMYRLDRDVKLQLAITALNRIRAEIRRWDASRNLR